MISHDPFDVLKEEFLATLKQAEERLCSGEEASELLKQCGSLHSKMFSEARNVPDDGLKKLFIQITKGYKIQLKSCNTKNDRIVAGDDTPNRCGRIAERMSNSSNASHVTHSHDDKGLLRESSGHRRRRKARKERQRSQSERLEGKKDASTQDKKIPNGEQEEEASGGGQAPTIASRAKGILSTVWRR